MGRIWRRMSAAKTRKSLMWVQCWTVRLQRMTCISNHDTGHDQHFIYTQQTQTQQYIYDGRDV